MKYKCPVCGFESDDPYEVFAHISKDHVVKKDTKLSTNAQRSPLKRCGKKSPSASRNHAGFDDTFY